jgi:hypothetical protein
MKNKLFFLATMAVTMLTSFLSAIPVSADDTKKYLMCDPSNITNCQTPSTVESDVNTLIGDVITYALMAVGAIAVIFLIIGGITFATSGGEAEKVKKAKSTILYSVIGLALAVLANIIVSLVFGITGEFK